MGGGFTMGGTVQPQPPAYAAAIGAILEQQEKKETDLAKRVLDERIAILSAAFDKSVAYNNLILIGGYAGAFTIWSNTKSLLPAKAALLVAIFLSISLCTFVIFEIYKMIVSSRIILKQRAIIFANHPPDVFLKEVAAEAQRAKKDWLKWILPLWVVNLVAAVSFALAAISLPFYNFLASLVGFSQWPI